MRRWASKLGAAALGPALATAAVAASFDLSVPPAGWEIVSGEAGAEAGIAAASATLVMRSELIAELPVEAVIRVRPAVKTWCYLRVVADGAEEPLLECRMYRDPGNSLRLGAAADGEAMETRTISSRTYTHRFKPSGSAAYEWRYPVVKNLWDERDRLEIGSDYERLTPFEAKLFVVRLRVTRASRQVWIDDRLVAERRITTAAPLRLAMHLGKGSAVQAVHVGRPEDTGRYLAMRLDDYRSDGRPVSPGDLVRVDAGSRKGIPLRLPGASAAGLDLGDSLYRYRLTVGSGPDAGYVNGRTAHPNPLRVDPAEASFRVPYRHYRAAWLTAWVDGDAGSVPHGSLRFYRDMAGYDARTDFEVTDSAVEDGLVTDLGRTTDEGRPLYLVRVPLDSDGLYGARDMSGQFLDFQVTKPLKQVRSYPDPIYYGYHPGGPPSSIHVVGITLEEGAFGYEVEPLQHGHVFEQPETPTYVVAVTNLSGRRLTARVRLETTSYDGSEQTRAEGKLRLGAGAGDSVRVELDGIKRFGWHELRVTVAAGDEVCRNTLSLILLPPNRRTYGNAANETRFGSWRLLGHYTAVSPNIEDNERNLAMMRRLGIRQNTSHSGFFTPDMLKRHDFLPKGAHTIVGYYHRLDVEDPEQMAKFLEAEREMTAPQIEQWDQTTYFYGGEWNYDHKYSYAPDPRYTGGEPYVLGEDALKNIRRQMAMFRAVGKFYRKESPGTKLILQWGSPMNTIGFLAQGFEEELIDGYGMDAPMFELTPEVPWVTGCINGLWLVRKEVERLGRPQHPIHWCEGPFLPTNDGALTERQQEENHVRYWLMGLAYGVEDFQAGIVPSDAGNYYGAEHYGAGVFRRYPLNCPKPAVAALATATTMLCGADVIGPVDTGVLTTYALAFRHARSGHMTYALWRVVGTVEAAIEVTGAGPAVVTDAMGNAEEKAVLDGSIRVGLSASPVWLTGVDGIEGFRFSQPVYAASPAAVTRALPAFEAGAWVYSGEAVPSYENNHMAMPRVVDPQLKVTFDGGEPEHPAAASVTLAAQPAGDRTMASRYGAAVLSEPAPIPGKAAALGVWMKGNSGWGRIAYQVRDAEGELWTSIGARDDWNCDDTHTWSYAKFEGWRYVRFPLPGNYPYDAARELETTWWNHSAGDGIVDLPLRLEKVFVEARNEVPYLGRMQVVPDRTYKLAGLVAEYATEEHAAEPILEQYAMRMPPRTWSGPTDNPIARMAAENMGEAPAIKSFTEPLHFNDGRGMVVHFEEKEGFKYALYLSRYADGRGADRLRGDYKDGQLVRGFRTGVKMYLFLVATDADGKQSKPSAPYELMTEDKFREK